MNWQVLALISLLFGPANRTLFEMEIAQFLPMALPLAAVATASLLLWLGCVRRPESPLRELLWGHLWLLRVLALLSVCATLSLPALTPVDIMLAALVFLLAGAAELTAACRQRREERVWTAQALMAAAVVYFVWFRVVTLGHGMSMFVVLGLGFVVWLLGEWARGRHSLGILTRPLQQTALAMPALAALIGIYRHVFAQPVWLGANSLALLLAAGFYFWRGLEQRSKAFMVTSAVILNIALALLWRELACTDPQFFMIPVGISILAFVQLLKQEIPERFHDPLRYLGALVILVSPTFHIVGGSWLHLFSLMLASVSIVLLAMGLRIRALMYTGTAFLVADLAAMVVRGSIDDPSVLWIAGLTLGAAVIALAAFCERNREAVLDRMRVLSDALRQWD